MLEIFKEDILEYQIILISVLEMVEPVGGM
jgi:hypothetical protein